MGLRDRGETSQADSNFIGRINILEDFATEWEKPIKKKPRFIVNLYGIGGIGKSRLLKRLPFEHEQNNIVCKLDANFDSIADPINILKTILDKTRYNDETIEFKDTRKLVARFDSLVQDAAKAGGNFSVSAISRFLVKGAQIGGEFIGGTETGNLIGEVSKSVAESGLADSVADYFDAVLKSAKNEQDNKLLQAPLREITAKLVQEIDKEIDRDTKFILIIDTYEKVPHDIDLWLLRDLLGEPVTKIDFDLRLIVAGREPLKERNRHWHDEWGGYIDACASRTIYH